MDIKTTYDSFKIDYEELLEEKQLVTQCNLDASSKGGVKKICFATADVNITNYQINNLQIKIQGQTIIKVVYFDMSDNIQSFDYISDFIENINSRKPVYENQIDVRGSVADCVSTIVGEEIRVQTVVQLAIASINSRESKLLTKVENAIYQANVEELQIFDRFLDESVTAMTDYKTGVNVEDIILFDSKVSIVDAKFEEYKIKFLGQAVISLIYKSEGIITEKIITFTFDKEIETTVKMATMCPYVVIRDAKLTIQGVENDNVFHVDLDMSIRGALFIIEERELIVDLYSPKYGIEVQEEYVPFYSKKGLDVGEEKINGLVLIEDDVAIKRIISCNVIQNDIVNLLSVPGEIVNEGLLVAAVIYEKEDGTQDSAQVEMPYSIRVQDENLVSGCKLEAHLLVLDIFSKVKRDKEIEITVTMISTICKCSKITLIGIEDVRIGDEIPYNDSSISVYKPNEGDSMWDVAKSVGMSMDEIKKQNPDLKDKMTGNESVVIYRELKV